MNAASTVIPVSPQAKTGSQQPLGALTAPRNVPTRLTLIPELPGEPRAFPTLAHLAQAVAERLGPARRCELVRGVAAYPGWDTFPCLTVHGLPAQGPLAFSAETWTCAVAIQDTPAEALFHLIEGAQRRGAA